MGSEGATKGHRIFWVATGGVFIVVWWHKRAPADLRLVK